MTIPAIICWTKRCFSRHYFLPIAFLWFLRAHFPHTVPAK
jgi:hypothetical protein